jgi:hypothetical protein
MRWRELGCDRGGISHLIYAAKIPLKSRLYFECIYYEIRSSGDLTEYGLGCGRDIARAALAHAVSSRLRSPPGSLVKIAGRTY